MAKRIRILSIVFFALSLTLPAMGEYNGFACLFLGWASIVGTIPWLGNVSYFFAWHSRGKGPFPFFANLVKKPRSLFHAGIAFFLALSTIFVPNSVQDDQGGLATLPLRVGFYVWCGSFLLMFVAEIWAYYIDWER